MKNLVLISMFISLNNFCLSQSVWDTTYLPSNYPCSDISFVNPNTGFSISYTANNIVTIYKTDNKGVNWSFVKNISSVSGKSKNAGIIFKSPTLGFISYDNKIAKYENGSLSTVFTFPYYSLWHRIIFVNDQTGYALFSYLNDTQPDDSSYVSIYKTINGGDSWFATIANRILRQTTQDRYSILRDIDFSKNDPNILHAVGYYVNGIGSTGKSLHIWTTDGFDSRTVGGEDASGIRYGHVVVADNNEVRILGNKGLKINIPDQNTYTLRYTFVSDAPNTELGMKFINNTTGYVALHNGKIMKTTNSGNNWDNEINIDQAPGEFQSARIVSFGEIVYYRSAVDSKFYTKKLSANFQTYFDNQSSLSSIIFDGTQYSSPSTQYLRGGMSTVSSNLPLIINPNQSNEKLFYKWSDGGMNLDNQNFYFDRSGTEIANYYKTKQLASSPVVINNMSQTNSLKDTLNAINQIHESMGGIFFSKSYNNGDSFKREEISNNNIIDKSGNGNKNPSIYEARDNTQYGRPVTILDITKNIVACWERFNHVSGKTEIKASGRTYYSTQGDTSFTWNNRNFNGDDIFTSFNSSSGFNSFPKIFAIAMDPFSNLGDMNTYFLIIPHLRPSSNGLKVQISARGTLNKYSEFSIDSGDVSDLSVTGSKNQYGTMELHLIYRKNSQIVYRKVSLEDNYTPMAINLLNMEGPTDISSGDGYSARYRPDISIMDGLPVVSYAANYNSNAWVSYESGEADIIQIHRYPIIKVHKQSSGLWGNYIIYNSTSLQDNPDIEGSSTTESYLINYSLGNGQFKKVVKVHNNPGYFCEPNTFTGTDSKLTKNSFTGSLGNNLSLLTLSPEASLYRLGKQNFAITNIITAVDQYDNFGGVVNLDTVRYSFNLGPIMIKEPDDELEEVPFGQYYDPAIPVVTPVEFNQNLRSNTFLLNEIQALLVGCNATYIKDANDAVINEVKYSVDLMNKTTGLLHRVLYSDTIHAEDSVATEVLRGFYITNIPNGADSFYVQININNDDIAEGLYSINPTYDENPAEDDNPVSYKTRVIYENESFQNPVNSIPVEYTLSQNYPNPFNPTTNLEFGISELGFVSLKIYDMLGKEVKTLVNETKSAGRYTITFDGSNLTSGIYFYKIEAGNFSQVKKMTLLK